MRILFTSVFLGVSRQTYKDFYISNDINAVDSDEFKSTLEVFNQLARYSKSFGDSNWNTQVRAVAENHAAANFMGDWARGEFMARGHVAGKDYGCQLTSSTDPSVLMAIDVLVPGKVEEQAEIDGQKLMLEIVSDAEINLQFNALKGSVSPYVQPDSSELDVCTEQVYSALTNNEATIAPYHSYFPGAGEYAGRIGRAIYDFWVSSRRADSNSSELVDQTLQKFRSILERKATAQKQSAAAEVE